MIRQSSTSTTTTTRTIIQKFLFDRRNSQYCSSGLFSVVLLLVAPALPVLSRSQYFSSTYSNLGVSLQFLKNRNRKKVPLQFQSQPYSVTPSRCHGLSVSSPTKQAIFILLETKGTNVDRMRKWRNVHRSQQLRWFTPVLRLRWRLLRRSFLVVHHRSQKHHLVLRVWDDRRRDHHPAV